VVVVAAGACKRKEQHGAHAVTAVDAAPGDARRTATAGARTPGALVAAGSLRDAVLSDGYAVLLPAGADVAQARTAIEAAARSLGVPALIAPGTPADVGFSIDRLRYFGRGLDATDTAALAKVTDLVVIDATGPTVADVVHNAAEVARAGAAATHGWILDRPTSETFTRAAFDAARPTGFPLDVDTTIVVHVVANPDASVFFESFGMVRFGLPEIFVRAVPQSFAQDTMTMVLAAAQQLVDRGGLERDGVVEVTGPAGTVPFTATWTLGDSADEPGAPPEIEPAIPGDARALVGALEAFFGDRPDEVHGAAENDPELLAASARARVELAKLATRFAHGVPELEKLLVKAPFTTDAGGVEWMWIEVQSWTGDRFTGVLINEPIQVSAVKVGDRVEARQADLFDYMHFDRDGTQTGGETDRILAAR
jgi:uncharacterized protein YegJ (DUF2314 family)